MSIKTLLEEIKLHRKNSEFSVASFSNAEKIYVGVDSKDRPCIFLSVLGNENLPSIKTNQVKVEYSKKYSLHLEGNVRREGVFHGIFCLSSDRVEISTFITIVDFMLSELGENITTDSINSIFKSLVGLFSIKPSQDYLNERRGLWGELFFMKHIKGFSFWAAYWHSEPTRLFDFSNFGKRVEIKSTIRTERIHDFNHGQLLALSAEQIFIVSTMLQEDDTGLSLRSLIDEASSLLSGTPHFLKLQKAIRVVNMEDLEESGPKFNEAYASQKIRWFNSNQIPKFPISEPQGVSGTHYKSDLSGARSLTEEEITQLVNNWTSPD